MSDRSVEKFYVIAVFVVFEGQLNREDRVDCQDRVGQTMQGQQMQGQRELQLPW